jgi:hypothetical protein
MVEIVLPRGGVCLALVEAYFDESIGEGRDHKSGRMIPILCVAGYLFHSEQAKALCADWTAVLRPYGLPYFHMVDCAHGAGIFEGIPKNERALIAAKMIGNIKRRSIVGLAVSVNLEHWDALAPDSPIIGSPYSFCVSAVMAGVHKWIETEKYDGDAAYFFEAGHKSRGEANWIMEQTYDVPALRKEARYIGHAFVDKESAPPVQAADLLAWQFYTDVRRQLEGATQHRKDFDSLINHPHKVMFITPDKIKMLEKAGFNTPEAKEILRLYHGDLVRAVSKGKPPPATPSFSQQGGQPS